MINLKQYLVHQQRQINKAITGYLPNRNTVPTALYKAMSYSVNSGGKRIRPILTLATGEMLGAKKSNLLPVACAIEFIHTYSLIHDDLPAMDNDDFRRGKPTAHKKFGEAIAILAGDALLTHAFKIMATDIKDAKLSQRLISEISRAVGAEGMVGGQVLDLNFTQKSPVAKKKCSSNNQLNGLYNKILIMKTAKLIQSSVICGAIVAQTNNTLLSCLETYGSNLGLAFQLKDDALDSPRQEKNSCLIKAKYLIDHAKIMLNHFGKKAEVLQSLADYVINRTY